jgi:para-nitrobenzyl esterase
MISTPELKQARFGAPSAEQAGASLGQALRAPTLAALRAMDAQSLTDAAARARFGPWGAVDGKLLPDQLVNVFDRGAQAPVPLIAGFNSGEIRSLRALAAPTPASAAAYETAIRERYGDLADRYLALYPSADMGESILAATRDALYGWTTERLVRKQAAVGAPSYLYLFDHGYPAADAAGLHAFHASEIPFVFGTAHATLPLWPKIADTPREAAMSAAMIDYWTSFARDGRPRAAGAPDWPTFGSAGTYMRFGDTPQVASGLFPDMYAMHEATMCRRRSAGDQPWNWNPGIASPKVPARAGACD